MNSVELSSYWSHLIGKEPTKISGLDFADCSYLPLKVEYENQAGAFHGVFLELSVQAHLIWSCLWEHRILSPQIVTPF